MLLDDGQAKVLVLRATGHAKNWTVRDIRWFEFNAAILVERCNCAA